MGLREFVNGVLERSQSADEIDWLLFSLADPDTWSSGPAARALARLDDSAVEERLFAVIRILDLEAGDWRDHYLVPDKEMLASLIKILQRRGPKAVPALIAALDDAHQEVRKAAAEALGTIGDPQAIEPLVQALLRNKREPYYYTWALTRFHTAATAFVLPLLAHQDPEIRLLALREAALLDSLGAMHTADALVAALDDPEPRVQDQAAFSLASLGDARAVAPLLAMLPPGPPHDRHSALLALGKLGDARIVQPLLDALQADASLLHGAVVALGDLGDPRGVEVVMAALTHERESIRFCAARSLGAIGDQRAVEPLIAALADSDSSVRQQAALALGALGDARAVAPLIAALREDILRNYAATALGMLGGAKAADALLGIALDQQLWGQSVWVNACRALSALRVPAPAVLFTTLDDVQSYRRRIAIQGLGLFGDPHGIEPLVSILANPTEDSAVRCAAADGLAVLGDERALQPLIAALAEDTEQDVRCSATKALGQMRNSQVLEPLLAALRDEEPAVRIAAATALGVLGDAQAVPALQAAERQDDGQRWDGAMVDQAAIEAIAAIQREMRIHWLLAISDGPIICPLPLALFAWL